MKEFIRGIFYKVSKNGRNEILQRFDDLQRILQNTEDQVAQMHMEIIKSKAQVVEMYLETKEMVNQVINMEDRLEPNYDTMEKALLARITRLEDQQHAHLDFVYRDILIALSQKEEFLSGPKFRLISDHKVAFESNDHLFPRGTKNDNTRAPFFIRKCEKVLCDKHTLSYLDLGCAGGGIVLDAMLRGHYAVGLEGSDFSYNRLRAEWRLLKDNLFTCDITQPFVITSEEQKQYKFDIISAWEVLEHIPEDSIDNLLDNIKKHLSEDGYFIGTAAQFEDWDFEKGINYHVCVKPIEWWHDKFAQNGLEIVTGLFSHADLARANGNPPLVWIDDWKPEPSECIVARKILL